jgi:hypothetical protein
MTPEPPRQEPKWPTGSPPTSNDGGSRITVIPAVPEGPSIAASARPASSSSITLPTSRPGRSVPSATMAIR